MITRRILLVLYVYLRLTSRFFYAIPFEVVKTGVSRADFKLRMCSDVKSFILFHINFSIQCETMIYSFLRLCQMHLTGTYKNLHPYVIHCFNMVGFGYPAYLQLYLMFYGASLCNYFNQTVAYDKKLRKKYWNNKAGKAMDYLESGVTTIVPFVYFQGFCFGMYSLMKPSKPFFHCSLLKDLGWSTSAKIPVKLYECYMFFNCWHVIVSTWLVLLVPAYTLVTWPDELIDSDCDQMLAGIQSQKPKKKFKSVDDLRQIPDSLPAYQHLYMLCNRLNAVARVWLVGISFFTGKLVGIYMGFATFQLALEQTLPWKEYMAYPTSCLFLLVLFGFASPQAEALHTLSCKYIRQLKNQPSRILQKSVRPLRPMGIWIIDMLCFKRGTGIETINDVVEEIGDLVVGFVGD